MVVYGAYNVFVDGRKISWSPSLGCDICVTAGAAVKQGTPLYGQPSWWGESDADEHNKQLLRDIQCQREQERQQRSATAAEVTKAAAASTAGVSRSSPSSPPKNMSAVQSE